MNILVTGSSGFAGTNLVWNLKGIRDRKDGMRQNLNISEIYCYDVGNTQSELEYACQRADFVFHLAGVNRPQNPSEYMRGNLGLAGMLLDTLKACGNNCPIMFASSLQASMSGRFADSEYGRSKLAGEELFFRYGEETGARIMVYRLPNLFGKWCRPDYNSAVATFCNAVANNLEYRISSPETELELLYIDDFVDGMLDMLEGKVYRCEYPKDDLHSGLEAVPQVNGRYCFLPSVYHAALGEIISLLLSFKEMLSIPLIPEIPEDSFAKRLFAVFLSYLPEKKMAYCFQQNTDSRGSFTELFRTKNCGQISVNVAKPGITRGQHWHNSKCEIFVVVSGHALIQERRIGTDANGEDYPVLEFEVTGDKLQAVWMLPGYTHNIMNLSKTENLVTVIWANEIFDEKHPDTFYEQVRNDSKMEK